MGDRDSTLNELRFVVSFLFCFFWFLIIFMYVRQKNWTTLQLYGSLYGVMTSF